MGRQIDKIRRKIDGVDKELMKLLTRRTELTDEIIDLKRQRDIPARDFAREDSIKTYLTEHYPKLDAVFLDKLYNLIFSNSIKSYRKKKYNKANSGDIRDYIQDYPLLIAGPCSVETEAQINRIAQKLRDFGIKFLRGGAFKPRTSPKSFQGLGIEGMKMLRHAATANDMFVVSEIMDSYQLDACYDMIDVIQIGSRNMTNFSLLKHVGRATAEDRKPVLLKRGFSSTINEFLSAAEYITSKGNQNVILCLRGIRTFEQTESNMRFTPDISSIIDLKKAANFPIVFDPSHATGNSEYVLEVAKAALAAGADGIMIETHDDPTKALSDGNQSILPEQLWEIIDYINDKV